MTEKPTFMGYRTYNWGLTEKDPIIAEISAIIKVEKIKLKDIAEISGVRSHTISMWIYGETRRPQFATLRAVTRALGYDLAIVRVGQEKVTQINALSRKRAIGRKAHG